MSLSYTATARFNASLEDTWGAWTKPDRLSQWLGALHSGPIQSGADFVLTSILPYHSGRHRLTECDPMTRLSWEWFVEGVPTEVDVTFESIHEGAVVHVAHTVTLAEGPSFVEPFADDGGSFYFLGQSWSNALYRLRSLLDGDRMMVEYGDTNNGHAIDLSLDITASAADIFSLLMDSDKLKQMDGAFFLDGTTIEPKRGGKYSYGWYPEGTPEVDKKDGPISIVDYEEGCRFSYGWYGPNTNSIVKWGLSAQDGDYTRVHFSHHNLYGHSLGNVWSYRSGWTETLYTLKWYLEAGGEPEKWLTDSHQN